MLLKNNVAKYSLIYAKENTTKYVQPILNKLMHTIQLIFVTFTSVIISSIAITSISLLPFLILLPD